MSKKSNKLRVINYIKLHWYLKDLTAEFDGFKLKVNVKGEISKVIELINTFKDYMLSIEFNLSEKGL